MLTQHLWGRGGVSLSIGCARVECEQAVHVECECDPCVDTSRAQGATIDN